MADLSQHSEGRSTDSARHSPAELLTRLKTLLPGLVIVAVVVMASRFVSEHYGAPAMLMALLFGIALNFVTEEEKPRAGIEFASKPLLRMGVALLGLRVSVDLALSLGVGTIALIGMGMAATIVFGLACHRFVDGGWRFAYLSACSVAICGASAAMAVAAILPKTDKSEEHLAFTVVGVTVLSTIAMIAYPILAEQLDLTATQAGIFFGATIHDVAQVVGAGFTLSPESGEIAVVVKLLRVSMLAPILVITTLVLSRRFGNFGGDQQKQPILPLFVVFFFAAAVVNSLGWIPGSLAVLAGDISRLALLAAIAAVGMKTSLKRVVDVGGIAILFLVIQTVLLAALVVGTLLATDIGV